MNIVVGCPAPLHDHAIRLPATSVNCHLCSCCCAMAAGDVNWPIANATAMNASCLFIRILLQMLVSSVAEEHSVETMLVRHTYDKARSEVGCCGIARSGIPMRNMPGTEVPRLLRGRRSSGAAGDCVL